MSTGQAQWLQPYHFQKGEDARRNRKGRGKSLTTLIKEALQKNVLCGSPIPNGMDAAEFLSEAIVGHAIKGHPTCISEVMARMEGRIGVETDTPQKVDTRPVIYIPDNGRDPATAQAGEVPIDPSGHSDIRGSSGGRQDMVAANGAPAPHQNGKELRGGDISANGSGDHE